MIEFILSNWKSIVLAYVLIGFAVFILIEIGWMWIVRIDDHDKEEFPEYYNDDEMGIGLVLIVGLIIGFIVGVFWLFILMAMPFLMLMDWIQRKHPHLLGNMLEDMEERVSVRKIN